MSAKRDLLKEAIEDAKAVKDTAIANAKAVLEEAFTPHLKSMLAAKLQEMEDEDLDEAKMDDLDEMKDEKELDEANEEINEEDLINDPKGPTAHGNVAEEELDELNLDELLAELEAEEMSEAKEEDMTEAKKKDDEDKKDLKEAEEEEVETEEEINIEDMTEEDLKSFIEDVIKDMVEAGELEAGEGMEGEEGEEMGGEEEMESEEEVSIDELLAEIEKEEMDEAKGKEDMDEAYSKMKKDLEEAYATIESMRKDINEVNLLNAKLLYLNKVLKANNLSETQQVNVIAAFDKAETVKEVKLVFETICESLVTKKETNTIKESRGYASKATGTTASNPGVINEVSETVRRMQKLAGII